MSGYSKYLFSKVLKQKMLYLSLGWPSQFNSLSKIESNQIEKAKAMEELTLLIKKLDAAITKLPGSKNEKKEAIKKLATLLNIEKLEDKDLNDRFLQEAIQKLISELNFSNLAAQDRYLIDLTVSTARIIQSLLDNTPGAITQIVFFINKYLIESFFDLIKKTIEKFINEATKKHLNLLKRNNSIYSNHIEEKNNSIRQRRIDALARLFDSDKIRSPCIALALVKNYFILGVNTPFAKNKNNLDHEMNNIKDIFLKKINIFQNFFKNIESEFKNNNNWGQILNNTYSKLELLGFSNRFQYTKHENKDRFKVDLCKITRSFLKSLQTNGDLGFSNEERKSLLTAKPIILFPNQEQEQQLKGKLHADQIVLIAILSVLKNEDISQFTQIKTSLAFISIDKKDIPRQPIPIGLPKLACSICSQNIDLYKGIVSYRGTSNITLNKTISSFIKKNDNYVVEAPHVSRSIITHIDDSSSEEENFNLFSNKFQFFNQKKYNFDCSFQTTTQKKEIKFLP